MKFSNEVESTISGDQKNSLGKHVSFIFDHENMDKETIVVEKIATETFSSEDLSRDDLDNNKEMEVMSDFVDELSLPELQNVEQALDDNEIADVEDRPEWFARNFPKTQVPILETPREQTADRICEECEKRCALYRCTECSLSLCYNCSDAIHMLAPLCEHHIRQLEKDDPTFHPIDRNLYQVPRVFSIENDRNGSSIELPDIGNSITPRNLETPSAVQDGSPPTPTSPMRNKSASLPKGIEFSGQSQSSTQTEEHILLPIGMNVFFFANEFARWSKELFHGTIINKEVRENTEKKRSNNFFYRIVWLRGIEMVPNGFFRASLLLPEPFWAMEIGVFPSQLSAFRAVLTAEKIARHKWRRESESGHLKSRSSSSFPSVEILQEILNETHQRLDQEESILRTKHLTKKDDLIFQTKIGQGQWNWHEWLIEIGREQDIQEEELVMNGLCDLQGLEIPWNPKNRVRFFLLDQKELLFQQSLQTHFLLDIIQQRLFVSKGFAYKKWVWFVLKHRDWSKRQEQLQNCCKIQKWYRNLVNKWKEEAKNQALKALRTLDIYRQRELQINKVKKILLKKNQSIQRQALKKWSQVIGLFDPMTRRHFEIQEPIEWHPSIGMTNLPRLPKLFSYMRPDGSLAIEDLKLFRQFRMNHAGPNDRTYWIIKDRILAGGYPTGVFNSTTTNTIANGDITTSILLQKISTFVCLCSIEELDKHEKKLHANGSIQEIQQRQLSQKNLSSMREMINTTNLVFEKAIRSRYQALHMEMSNIVRLNSKQLDQAEKDLVILEQEQASSSRHNNNNKHMATSSTNHDYKNLLLNKILFARENLQKAEQTIQQISRPLIFLHFPIKKDNIPNQEDQFLNFLKNLENLLRQKENLYIFSLDGHGRTGFLGALLLGRLYGISSKEALERAQRVHDSQVLLQNMPSNRLISSPKALCQIAMVQRLLACSMEEIYVPVIQEGDDGLRIERKQQRGVVVEQFRQRDGFMISENPNEKEKKQAMEEYERLQRITRKEIQAAILKRNRKIEAKERQLMAQEEEISHK